MSLFGIGSCSEFMLFFFGVREPCSRFDWAKHGFAHALSRAQLEAQKAPAWLAHSRNSALRTDFRHEPNSSPRGLYVRLNTRAALSHKSLRLESWEMGCLSIAATPHG